jgi:hypothetical protein
MSKQYNKIEKRKRRRAYIKRKNAATKAKKSPAAPTVASA